MPILVLVLFLFTTMSCSNSARNRKWLSCSTILDTTKVIEDWDRGTYLINDSLVLFGGFHPFDTSLCDTIQLRVKPIVSYRGKLVCSLSDLYPPFKIYKAHVSDTLTVIKDGKVIFFKIPSDFCK
jgi:hypothetical protein